MQLRIGQLSNRVGGAGEDLAVSYQTCAPRCNARSRPAERAPFDLGDAYWLRADLRVISGLVEAIAYDATFRAPQYCHYLLIYVKCANISTR